MPLAEHELVNALAEELRALTEQHLEKWKAAEMPARVGYALLMTTAATYAASLVATVAQRDLRGPETFLGWALPLFGSQLMSKICDSVGLPRDSFVVSTIDWPAELLQ
jgi:FtsH-binding integral membrane protein